MDDDNSTTIATIEKSATQDIRVRLAEFHGKTYIDLRVFVPGDAIDRIPTRKGIAVPPALLADVIDALHEAQRRAVDLGILEPPSDAA